MQRKPYNPTIESLELRCLLAAGAAVAPDGTLTVTGTDGSDQIVLHANSSAVSVNGKEYEFFYVEPIESYIPITRTIVRSLGGDDQVFVNESFAQVTPVFVDLGAGDDTVTVQDNGKTSIECGRGDDTIQIVGVSDLRSVHDSGGNDSLDLARQDEAPTLDMNLYHGIENALWTKSGLVIGNSLDNYITAYGSWPQTLRGGGGNDTLIGSQYDDSLDGGAGNDLLDAGGGNNTLIGGSGRDTLLGGLDDLFLTRDHKKDQIIGNGGDDTIIADKKDKITQLP